MKIAYLTPTRERSSRRRKFQESVVTTADNADVVTFYYYIDNDDPQLDTYLNQDIIGNRIDHVDIPQSVSKGWNVIAQRAIDDGADVLMMGNDDLIQLTKGWDTILLKKIEEYPDPMYCFWFEDSINGNKHNAFPIVSKEWYNLLGYFTPGVFNFGYNDTWIYHVSMVAGKSHFIPEVVTKHEHFAAGHQVWDNTYARNRTSPINANAYGRDEIIFNSPESREKMQKDGQKIKEWLEKYEKSSL